MSAWLTAAFLEAGLAERAASGELFHPDEDLVYVGLFRTGQTAVPAFEFAMLLVLGVGDGDGVEEQFEAGDATDIFGWGAAGAVDVAGILDSGINTRASRSSKRSHSRPIVEALEPWLREKLSLISQKTKLAEATACSRWEGLTRFLDDGRNEIDGNIGERSIWPTALNRKNARFAGDGGC